jgi:hypothetical protein
MNKHLETEYVLSNPILIKQIGQFQQTSKASLSQTSPTIDFDYILSNSDLFSEIQLLIESHKQKHH